MRQMHGLGTEWYSSWYSSWYNYWYSSSAEMPRRIAAIAAKESQYYHFTKPAVTVDATVGIFWNQRTRWYLCMTCHLPHCRNHSCIPRSLQCLLRQGQGCQSQQHTLQKIQDNRGKENWLSETHSSTSCRVRHAGWSHELPYSQHRSSAVSGSMIAVQATPHRSRMFAVDWQLPTDLAASRSPDHISIAGQAHGKHVEIK